MTTTILHISELIDPAVLQHLQDSFANQYRLSIQLFDTRGKKLTRPSAFSRLTPELAPILDPFLDFILTNPPHFADLGLKDGNTVFASFFNGIFHRAILPLMVQRQALGAAQLVACHDLESFDIGRWHYILDGFTWNDVSYLAFLDSQSHPLWAEWVQSTALYKTQLTEMLESGYSRYKIQQAKAVTPVRVGHGKQSLVTNRLGDILSASAAMAELLHYDSAEEMIGLNAVEHLTIDTTIQEELRETLAQGEPETEIAALMQTKDGLLLRVTWQIFLERDDGNNEVGLLWEIEYSTEVRNSGPEVRSAVLQEIYKNRLTATPGADQKLPPERAHTDERISSSEDSGIHEQRDAAASTPSREAESPSAEDEGSKPAREKDTALSEAVTAKNTSMSAGAIAPEMLEFMDALSYPLFAIDGDNRILLWNKQLADLLKIAAPAVMGLDFSNLLVGESQKQWHQWLFEFRLNSELAEYKPSGVLYVLDNSGEVFAISLELTKGDLPAGQVITATLRSCEKSVPPLTRMPHVSQKAAAENELLPRREKTQETTSGDAGALDAFSASLERQWQPFYAQLTQLVHSHALESTRREDVRTLLKEAESLTSLLQQMRYVAGGFRVNTSSVPVVRVLRYAANTQERLFSRSGPITWQVSDENVMVQGDMVLLYHAAVYLLDYILRVRDEGRPIYIKVTTSITAQENAALGRGVPMVLFEGIYSDQHSPLPDPQKGILPIVNSDNCGLAAVQAIIAAHQGVVRIAPVGNEQRALQIFLPLASPAVSSKNSTATILVIDDEPGIVQMNALMLEHAGFTVLTALRGAEGLRLLREHAQEIGAIVLDWRLQDLSCQEMAAEITQISKAPIILATGYLPDAEIKAIIEQYSVRFLQKPYTPAQLIHTVTRAIEGKPQ